MANSSTSMEAMCAEVKGYFKINMLCLYRLKVIIQINYIPSHCGVANSNIYKLYRFSSLSIWPGNN